MNECIFLSPEEKSKNWHKQIIITLSIKLFIGIDLNRKRSMSLWTKNWEKEEQKWGKKRKKRKKRTCIQMTAVLPLKFRSNRWRFHRNRFTIWTEYARFDFVPTLDIFAWTCSFHLPLWWHLFCIHKRLHCRLGVSATVLSKHMWLNIWVASFECVSQFFFLFAPIASNINPLDVRLCTKYEAYIIESMSELTIIGMYIWSTQMKWIMPFQIFTYRHSQQYKTQELPQQAQIRIHISDQTE